MTQYTHFVGMDVHADSIVMAGAAAGGGEAQALGVFPGGSAKAVVKVLERMAPLANILCCYEAGPTGYGLQRELQARGVQCRVVAPSLVPRRPGDQVKTDRRDAKKLAHYLRSGDLTTVRVPEERTEAIRDLERARGDAKKAEQVARQNLGAFLLRRGRRYTGKTRWTLAHRDWIRKQPFEHEASRRVLEDYLHALEEAEARVARLEKDIAEVVAGSHLAPLVRALQALRGVDQVTAVVLAAELGDLKRFESAPELMAYVGLVPSENTTGDRRRQGGITKTGNGHVRRVLVESAWAYRYLPAVTAGLRKRQQGVHEEVCAVAWKAQQRLCRRYRRLLARGKNKQQTVTAIARELAGFVWAIGQKQKLLAD